MHNRMGFVFRLTVLAMVLCCIFSAAGMESWYTENEWNYLDTAMDISGGIPEDASGNLARIQRSGVLKVATDLEFPPMSFQDPEANGSDQYAGLDIALAREIAKKMGVELVIVPKQPIYKLPAVMNGQADLAISAITYNPGRALSYTLSEAYYIPADLEKDIGIVVRTDRPITSLEDLRDKKIAVQSNSLQETFASTNEELKKCQEIRRTASSRTVYEMVRDGSADAGIVSIRIANTYFLNDPECGLLLADGLAFSPEAQFLGYRVAAKKGETQLIAFVNGVIEEAGKNGDIDRWIAEALERTRELGLSE